MILESEGGSFDDIAAAWGALDHAPDEDVLHGEISAWLATLPGSDAADETPCEAFGRSRGQAGFTLRETLADLDRVLRPLDDLLATDLPWALLYRRVTEGWVDDLLRASVGFGSVDPATGLPTLSFLRALLDQWAIQRGPGSASPAPDHVLLVVRRPGLPAARHDRFAAQADAGRRLAGLGRPGEHVVSIGPAAYAALLFRDDPCPVTWPALLEALGGTLEAWAEPVPGDLDPLWDRLLAAGERRA